MKKDAKVIALHGQKKGQQLSSDKLIINNLLDVFKDIDSELNIHYEQDASNNESNRDV